MMKQRRKQPGLMLQLLNSNEFLLTWAKKKKHYRGTMSFIRLWRFGFQRKRKKPCIGESVRWRPAEASSSAGKPQKHSEGREGSVAAAWTLITAALSSSVLFARPASVHNTGNLTGGTVPVTFIIEGENVCTQLSKKMYLRRKKHYLQAAMWLNWFPLLWYHEKNKIYRATSNVTR